MVEFVNDLYENMKGKLIFKALFLVMLVCFCFGFMSSVKADSVTVTGAKTKVYGLGNTTLTCNIVEHSACTSDPDATIHYTFMWSDEWWSTDWYQNDPDAFTQIDNGTSNTYVVAKNAFLGERYYFCSTVCTHPGDGAVYGSGWSSDGAEMVLRNVEITFNANGGSLSGSNKGYVAYDDGHMYDGEFSTSTMTVPSATKSGYDFAGWFTASSGGQKVLNADGTLTGVAIGGWTNSNRTWARSSDGTLHAQYIKKLNMKPSISGGATKVYNSTSTTLTCSTSETPESGASLYYSFGYADTDGGTPSHWTAASTTNTYTVAKNAYVGQRYYSCRVYQSDGSRTGQPVASLTTADTEMTINNAAITFNGNGGGSTGVYYTKYGVSSLYTGIRNTTTVTLPALSKTGYTFAGWYTASSGGTRVIYPDNSIVASVSEWTNASSQFIRTDNNGTLYAQFIQNPATPTITGGATKVYNSSATTLTCATTTTYPSGTNLYYSFGYATTDGGTPSNWTEASTTNTYTVTKDAYVGQRWYSCRVYANDGTISTSTATSSTSSDAEMTINNAKITFNNNGTTTSTLYSKYGTTGLYTGIRNTTAGTIPTATKTGYTFAGWYTAASGGSKVINADKSVVASVSNWTNASKQFLRTADSTLYAQFTINNPATPTITGGTTKIYNASNTTLTCATTSTYASGTSLYYSFGYATSDGGTPSNWTEASTTATLTIAKDAYVGQRWYSCRVYASDGTLTSSTVASTTTADQEVTINNAKMTFNANDGILPGSTTINNLYSKYGETNLYTGIRSTSVATIPVASKTGYTFTGWYTASSGGTKVINADKSVVANVSNWTNASKQFLRTADSTLYAQFTANTYQIEYELNNGTQGANAPTMGTYDQDVQISNLTKTVTITGNANNTGATIGEATSEAQTFAGWTSTTVGSNAKTGTAASPSNTWTGTSTTNTFFKNLRESGTVTMIAGWTPVNITLPTLSKTGYTCAWYSEAGDTGGTKIGDSGETYTTTANEQQNITVYARCEANPITVTKPDGTTEIKHYGDTYDLGTNEEAKADENGAQITFDYQDNETAATIDYVTKSYTPNGWIVNNEQQADDTVLTLTEDIEIEYNYTVTKTSPIFPEPTREHYTFDGWFDDEEEGEEVTEYTGDENITLYAYWTGDSISVTKPDGTEETKHYGDTYDLGTNEEAKADENGALITFKYQDNETADTTANVTRAYTPNGWLVNDADALDNEVLVLTEDIVIDYNYDIAYTSPTFPEPTREHYTFDGWYDEATGGNEVTSYNGTNDTTVYAHWIGDEVRVILPDETVETHNYGDSYTLGENTQAKADETATVTFKYQDNETEDTTGTVTKTFTPNGWLVNGAAATDNEVLILTEDITIEYNYYENVTGPTFPEPTREHYEFEGWYDEAAGGNEVTNYTDLVDTNLYAHWTGDPITVTKPDNTTESKHYGDSYDLGTNDVAKANEDGALITFKYQDEATADTTANVTKSFAPNGWLVNDVSQADDTVLTLTEDITINYNYDITYTSPTFPEPTREHYTFDGWYDETTGGNGVTSYNGTNDTTFYAHWIGDPITVTLPDNTTETYHYGDSYTLGTNDVTKADENGALITFKYQDNETADTTANVTRAYTPNGWLVNDVSQADDTVLTLTEDITINYNYDITYTSPTFPEPTRENHTFNGWFDAAEEGNKVTSYNGANDTIVYAHWTLDKPTGFTIDNDDIYLMFGDTYQMEVTFTPDGTTDNLVFSEYDHDMLAISSTGLITGLAPGTATVTVALESNPAITKEVTITVLDNEIVSETLTVATKEIARIIIGEEPKTKIEDFLSKIDNPAGYLKVYDKDDTLIEDYDTMLTTGMKVKLVVNDHEYDEAIVIIRGDIDEDGQVQPADNLILKDHLLKKSYIEGYRLYAADVDEEEGVLIENAIKPADNNKLMNYLLKKSSTLNN